MGRRTVGQRLHWLARAGVLFAATVFVWYGGVAQAQDEPPVPVLISAQVSDTAEAVFGEHIWDPIVQSKCLYCHVEGGISGHTRLVFELEGDEADHLQTFANFLGADEHDDEHPHHHGHELILVKIQGAGHGGGEQVAADSDDFDYMDWFLALLTHEMAEEAAAEEFRDHISQPIVQAKCVNCHVEGGFSGHTRLVLVRSDSPDHEAQNLQAFTSLLAAVASEGGASYVLDKIQGMRMHGGGMQVAADSDDFDSMEHFLALLEDESQGFVARVLEALDDMDASMMPMMFGIDTPQEEDTVAGSALAVSAAEAPTEAVHFAYRLSGDAPDMFGYLGAAANRNAALYAWDTSAMADGDYELAALYTEDGGENVTYASVEVAVANDDPAQGPDIEEDPGRKEQSVAMDERNDIVTSGGVMVSLPDGALDADDRITIAVMDFPDADTAPGDDVGDGTIDIALDSGQSTFNESVTIRLPYYEGRPDGIVHGTEIPETELTLWFFDAAAGAWEMVAGSTVDGAQDLVMADVTETGEYGIFHAPMMMAEVDEDDAMEMDTGDGGNGGGGGGGCAMLPFSPPGGPPDDFTLVGLMGLA
ncbi:MAG: hypothetical protein OXP66_17870, partial [Candidatus Tectomicrobia bacterium]|nr:hypothetical protein [Candidatus Tectomicrobia bacterium]